MYHIVLTLAIVIGCTNFANAFPATTSGDAHNMSLMSRWTDGPSTGLAVWGTVLVRGEGGLLVLTDYANPSAPVETARITVPIHPRQLLLDGDILAIRNQNGSEVVLLDLSLEGAPVVGFIDREYRIEGWAMEGQRLALSLANTETWDRSLEIIDITDPATPVILDTGITQAYDGLVLSGSILLASDQNNLVRYDISNPLAPLADGSIELQSISFVLEGSTLFAGGPTPGFDLNLSIIDPFAAGNPALLGEISWASGPWRVHLDIEGDLAYVSNEDGELQIVDIQDPANPQLRGMFDGDYSLDIAAIGHSVFSSLDYGRGLEIIDASDPDAPLLAEHVATGRPTYGLTTAGNHAYIYGHENFIEILDISDPAHPVHLGSIDTGDEVWGLAATGDLLLISNDVRALRVYDCSDPEAPVIKFNYGDGNFDGTISIVGDMAYLAGDDGLLVVDLGDPDAITLNGPFFPGLYLMDFCASGSFAYGIGDLLPSLSGALYVIDVSDPSAPTLSSGPWLQGIPESMTIGDGFLYVCSGDDMGIDDPVTPTAIEIFDLTIPSTPTLAGSITVPDQAGSHTQAARPLLAVDGYLYVSAGIDGVIVYDLADTANPQEYGYYDTGDWGRGFASSDQFIYVADRYDGVYILRNEAIVPIEDRDGPAPRPLTSLAVSPNPFNPSTEIRYTLEAPGFVNLTVVDARGRTLARLDCGLRPRGTHRIRWDGLTDQGLAASSGVYFTKFETEDRIETIPMTLLR